MEYLYILQNLREAAPNWLNEAILFVSEFVGGIGGVAIMALVYWCINKRAGALLMLNYSFAYLCNGVLKDVFCVERPFVRDARLEPYVPVKGYSFPSGHTMLATGFYGGIAVYQRRRAWVVVLCVLLTLMTAFSRNWLGAHTAEDVLVGMVCSCGLIALNAFLLNWVEKKSGRDGLFFAVSVLIFVVLCILCPVSMKVAGIFGGVMLGWFVERRAIRFEVGGSWLIRAALFAAGMLVVGGLHKLILPRLFAPLDSNWAGALNYFLTFLVITAGWPIVIKAIGKKTGMQIIGADEKQSDKVQF